MAAGHVIFSSHAAGLDHRQAKTQTAVGQGLAQVDELVDQRVILAEQSRDRDRVAKDIADIRQPAQDGFATGELAKRFGG